MIKLYAQPYDINAVGFFFETTEQYEVRAKDNLNSFGDPVEEYEIQFIDGDQIDSILANVWCLNQINFQQYFDAMDEWDKGQKQRYIIAVGECGYSHEQVADDLDCIDIDIYAVENLKELAGQFVEEGLFGEIPESLQFYIDYDAIARDLAADYSETMISSDRLVYRCG